MDAKSMPGPTTIPEIKLWSVSNPKYALELKGGLDKMPLAQSRTVKS